MPLNDTVRIFVEAPSGDRFEAETPCGTPLNSVAADFFEAQGWPTQDRRGRGQSAIVELVNPLNPDETKRLNGKLDVCEALEDGDTLRIFPEPAPGGPRDYASVLKQIEDILRPNLHWTEHPSSSALPAGVVGDEPVTPAAPLTVFLSYTSDDRLAVVQLYHRLRSSGFQPWLDAEDLMPGKVWKEEIRKVIRKSQAVMICLSRNAITKAGFFQREIELALEVWREQPEDTVFLIPARLEDCKVPSRLSDLQWVDLFKAEGYPRLLNALLLRAEQLGLKDAELS